MTLLSREDILRGLRTIDERAKKAGLIIELAIYGGAAMSLVFDMRRATRDVDAVVHGDPMRFRELVKQIAREEGWPESWLNDGVKGFLSANEALVAMEEFLPGEEGGLRLFTPTPEYLFAMKCMAMRPQGHEGSQDFDDIRKLAEIAQIKTADEALSLVESFYPPERIPPKVRFGIEEIMHGLARNERMTPSPD